MFKKQYKFWMLAAMVAIAASPVQAKKIMARPDAQTSLCDVPVSSAQTGPSDDIAVSRWSISYQADKSEEARSYELRFLPGGRLLNNHPNDTTPDNDRWESKGRYVVLRFNDNFAIYTGVLNKAENQISGHAVNSGGSTWAWSARRLPPCSALRK